MCLLTFLYVLSTCLHAQTIKPANSLEQHMYPAAESKDLIPFRKGQLWGFCSKEKEVIIPARYFRAEPFSNGLALVSSAWVTKENQMREGLKGYIDSSGNQIIPLMYTEAESFRDGKATVRIREIQRTIDTSGKIRFKLSDTRIGQCFKILSEIWQDMNDEEARSNFGNELKKIKKYIGKETRSTSNYLLGERTWREKVYHVGVKNRYGKIVIQPRFQDVYTFNKNLFIVVTDERKYGLIDKNGKTILPCIYDHISLPSEGLSIIELNSKYGYINELGEITIPLQFAYTDKFCKHLAVVGKIDNIYGVINTKGEEVIPLYYNFIKIYLTETLGQIIYVEREGQGEYLDAEGNPLSLPPTLCRSFYGKNYILNFLPNGLVEVINNNYYGLGDINLLVGYVSLNGIQYFDEQ